MENVDQALTELQNEIEKHLDLPKYSKKNKGIKNRKKTLKKV